MLSIALNCLACVLPYGAILHFVMIFLRMIFRAFRGGF